MVSKYISKIGEELNSLQELSDEDLIQKVQSIQNQKNEKSLKKVLPTAFALVQEATRRSMKTVQFDNQLEAAIELANGKVVELHPGEGKSFTIFLTAFLQSLTGKKVHIMVENDFLLQRDFQKAFRVFKYLGLSVGAVPSRKSNDYEVVDKTKSYNSDIVYINPVEAALDYLKSDNKDTYKNTYLIIDDIDRIIATDKPVSVILLSENGGENESILLVDFIKKYLSFSGIADFALKKKFLYNKYLNKSVVAIRDNIKSKRIYLPDNFSKTKEEKWDKIIEEIIDVHKYKCPVLLVIPNKNEVKDLTLKLDKKGFKYYLATDLNSNMDIFNLSQAGCLSYITIVSQPSGVDIPLGGDAFYMTLHYLNATGYKINSKDWNFQWQRIYSSFRRMANENLKEAETLGGIYAIITEHTNFDDVFESYSARRGDPGSVKYFVSLEDDFLKCINLNSLFSIMNLMNLDENQLINNSIISSVLIKIAKFLNDKNHKIV